VLDVVKKHGEKLLFTLQNKILGEKLCGFLSVFSSSYVFGLVSR